MTAPTPVRLRPGLLADSESIARVHVESWWHTYRGLLPDSVLGAHTVEARTAKWDEWFRNGDHSTCWVAEDSDGEIVGFGSGGAERTGDHGIDSELYTLYLTPTHIGSGIGTSLFARIRDDLRAQGHGSMLAWVLVSNVAATRFYEKRGGERIAERPMRFRGNPQTRRAYAWRDIRTEIDP